MQFIFLKIALALLFSHFHRVLSLGEKQVWEFGKSQPQSYIILNEEGRVNKRFMVLDLKVPHCNEVDYVKVEVDNPAATPEVTSNFKSVTITYNKDQISDSTYKVVVKSHKTCDLRRFMKCAPGNVCIYESDKPKKKPREPKNSSDEEDSSDEENSSGDEGDSSGDKVNSSRDKPKDDKTRKVWQFGKDVSGSFLMTYTKGRLGKGSKGVKFKLQETKCQRVAYVKVVVENSATMPKVTSNKKIVSISYNHIKNKRESMYKIRAKGVKLC